MMWTLVVYDVLPVYDEDNKQFTTAKQSQTLKVIIDCLIHRA